MFTLLFLIFTKAFTVVIHSNKVIFDVVKIAPSVNYEVINWFSNEESDNEMILFEQWKVSFHIYIFADIF